MKRISKLGVGAAVVAAGMSFAGTLMAQEAAEAGGNTSGEVGMTLPGAAGPKAAAAQGESDHDAMVGHFAVGYLGTRSVPLATGGGGVGIGSRDVDAPVIGIRYWLDGMIGIDAGLGFSNDGGSTTVNNTTTDKAATTAVLVHAGVPLALAGAKHFSFQIVPEVNVGFATQTQKQPVSNDEDKFTGTTIQVGVRAGAEIHFGFIDIPQLSLQGGVGIHYRTDKVKDEFTPGAGGNTVTAEDSTFLVHTTLNGEPWDIFTGNIAALYYF